MHRYYQKNLKKWHKTLNSYMNYISYELESLTGQSYDTLIQEIWTNYQEEMLERFPYIWRRCCQWNKEPYRSLHVCEHG